MQRRVHSQRLYASSGGGDIAFDVNGKQVSGPITITSTYNASDPICLGAHSSLGAREGVARMRLRKGVQVLTLRVLTKGQMNFAH